MNILPKTEISGGGTPWHQDGTTTSVAESEEEVMSFTLNATTTRTIESVIGVACAEGVFTLKNGADILAVFATTPSNFKEEFKFSPPLPISSGSTIKLFFTANEDNPVVDVFGFLMGRETTS